MCTAIVSFDPASATPVLLAGVRDEIVTRAWQPPARYWPDRPELVGGRDEQAGGTWLAVDTALPRVATVLNGMAPPTADGAPGLLVPEEIRRSRGVLPLQAAATGGIDHDLVRFEPFHLVAAEPDAVRLWSWDGRHLTDRKLEPGLHFIVNSGQAEPGAQAGDDRMSARVAHFRPRFEAVSRDPEHWWPLLAGDGLDPTDQRALIVRHELPDGRIWGTTSVSLVTLGAHTLHYDFRAEPGTVGPVL